MRATSELLRVATAGSVDDGKSTLIGRLLYETKQVYEDQLEHVEAASRGRGDSYLNLALLTDGLRAEREQGITIDVAHRYFQTPRRKFILADTPGHEQYTRNMVTGASTAEVALVLVDARKGVVEQSRRHALIASLLRIPHVAVCVNKMDLVGFEREPFDRVAAEFPGADVIPVAALHGDNVVEPSGRMPWYEGPTLLGFLEELEVAGDRNLDELRFPVQWVTGDVYAGQVASGVVQPGDEVTVLPGSRRSRVAAIVTKDGELGEAFPPLSVALRLEDDLGVSRGDMIAAAGREPVEARSLEATLCWMHDRPLTAGDRFLLKHTTRTVGAEVAAVVGRLDVRTADEEATGELRLNDIGRVRLELDEPVFCDPYERNRTTGSFILIEASTGDTAGAGMVV